MRANVTTSARGRWLVVGNNDHTEKPVEAKELQDLLQNTRPPRDGVSLAHDSSGAQQEAVGSLSRFDYGVALRDADEEIVEIITQPFRDEWTRTRLSLTDSLLHDLKALERDAHALKGTLAMFGAEPASDLAARIESKAHEGDSEQLESLVLSLFAEVDHLLAVLPRGC